MAGEAGQARSRRHSDREPWHARAGHAAARFGTRLRAQAMAGVPAGSRPVTHAVADVGKLLRQVPALVWKLPQFLVRGPRHRWDDERPGICETLLPWPLPVLLVLAAWLLCHVWVDTNPAGQLGWTLDYAGVVAISLAASLWWLVLLVSAASAVLWIALTLAPTPDRVDAPLRYWTTHGVELVNRQLSHVEAFWIWMGVLLPLTQRITFQLPALLGLALLGPALIDWITEALHPTATRGSGELQSARRPSIYLFTWFGVLVLMVRSGPQALGLVPLCLALTVVLLLRLLRHGLRQVQVAHDGERVRRFRRHQRELTRGIDVVFGPILMLISVVGVLALSLYARGHHDELVQETLDGPPPDPQTCVPEPGGPTAAALSMFLVSDSQVHELGGDRFPGQTELADLLVPSAVRPVELDMLGMASVAWLRRMYGELAEEAAGPPDAAPRRVLWAHLGDFADLSCTGELQRAIEMFHGFGANLAGIAPGNHDMSFTGNFAWSPYWTGACASRRADKAASNRVITDLLRGTTAPGSTPARDRLLVAGAEVSPPAPSRWSWLFGTGGLVTVTPLGSLGAAPGRSVVAIFVDTGDDAALDWGIAGLFGTYSADQDRRLRGMISRLTGVTDPIWIVFAHHPLDELTGSSRARLEATLAWLDRDPRAAHAASSAATAEPGARLLAIIAAHTHRAATHRVCVAGRVVRELVIGSTIDSAQQGAVLEVGLDHRGAPSLRLKTVPTVARPGFTCGKKPTMIDADECQRIMAGLKGAPSCAPLFDEDPKTARDCSELEQTSGLGDRVKALIGSTNPVKPEAIKDAQKARARRLMSCVCRAPRAGDGAPSTPGAGSCPRLGPGDDPLDDDLFTARMRARLASGGVAAEKELACLSWAASALQQHKSTGMSFASALRCAFDDQTIPAALESVATLEVQPCQ